MTNDIDKQKKELIRLATQQQMSAADPEKSVWVEASAGTRKNKSALRQSAAPAFG